MTSPLLLFLVLVALNVTLWVGAILMPLSQSGRFRVFACAVGLSLILAAQLIGWGKALAVAGLGVWIAAIVMAVLPGNRQTA